MMKWIVRLQGVQSLNIGGGAVPFNTGIFRDNHLRGNGRGSWSIAEGAKIHASGNLDSPPTRTGGACATPPPERSR